MDYPIVEKDGKKYYQVFCSKCNSELLFRIHEEDRRVYGACAKCGKSIDVFVPSEKNILG